MTEPPSFGSNGELARRLRLVLPQPVKTSGGGSLLDAGQDEVHPVRRVQWQHEQVRMLRHQDIGPYVEAPLGPSIA